MATVHVLYTVEQDEDGIWNAHAWLGSSGRANGNGATPQEAVADLREAVEIVLDEDGVPDQLSARGVKFNDPPTPQPYGVDTSFRDPSGNNIRLTQVMEFDPSRG